MQVVGISSIISHTSNAQEIEQGAEVQKDVIGFQESMHVQERLTWGKILFGEDMHDWERHKYQSLGSDDLGSGGRIFHARNRAAIVSGDESGFVLFLQLYPDPTSENQHIATQFY